MGRTLPLPAEVAYPTPLMEVNLEKYVAKLQRDLQQTCEQMPVRHEKPSLRECNPFKIWEQVLIASTLIEWTQKLSPKWTGPYTVVKIIGGHQIEYQRGHTTRRSHINLVKKYFRKGPTVEDNQSC